MIIRDYEILVKRNGGILDAMLAATMGMASKYSGQLIDLCGQKQGLDW